MRTWKAKRENTLSNFDLLPPNHPPSVGLPWRRKKLRWRNVWRPLYSVSIPGAGEEDLGKMVKRKRKKIHRDIYDNTLSERCSGESPCYSSFSLLLLLLDLLLWLSLRFSHRRDRRQDQGRRRHCFRYCLISVALCVFWDTPWRKDLDRYPAFLEMKAFRTLNRRETRRWEEEAVEKVDGTRCMYTWLLK